MALINATLFFKNNRIYGVGAITFDLILNESHNFSNTVTQYNIENGSNISDHIQNEPITGQVSGLITNFNINLVGFFVNNAQAAFEKLEELYKKQELVTIVTVLKVYQNVAITNITINRDKDTGEALFADFSFQEINIVSLQEIVITASVNIKDMTSNLNQQASPLLNAGKTVGL